MNRVPATRFGAALLRCMGSLMLVLVVTEARAHPDVELQIERVTREISLAPDDASLLRKRAELHRAHGDFETALVDLRAAFAAAPGMPELEFQIGTVMIESGRLSEGIAFLDSYLQKRPDSAAAHASRGDAHRFQGDYEAAAGDYALAIGLSSAPSPSLRHKHVMSVLAGGFEYYEAALEVALDSIERHGPELGLIGIATDVALALAHDGRARSIRAMAPAGLNVLPAWSARDALLACYSGEIAAFRAFVASAQASLSMRRGIFSETWLQVAALTSSAGQDLGPADCARLARRLVIERLAIFKTVRDGAPPHGDHH